jgi:dihydrofolate reductase
MGRKTFESINKRELPKRKNIIISKTIDNKELTIFNTPEKAITYCKENSYT